MKENLTLAEKPSSREVALKALVEIETKGAFAEETVDKLAKAARIPDEERRFTAEIALGTTKLKKRLDYILGFLLKDDLDRLTPWIRNILRSGIYQLEFMHSVPEYAAVSESVNLAKKFGHGGTASLVNAVLRNYSRRKEEIKFPAELQAYLSNYYSFPEWMIEKWLTLFGEENTVKLCQYYNQKPKVGFRINTLKSSCAEVEDSLAQLEIKYKKGELTDGFYYLESPLKLSELKLWQEGKIYLQDEASLLAVELLSPQPGETILDLCAAPGGKATYMAQRMKNQGKIVAVDKSKEKLERIRENCRRLGAEIVDAVLSDALQLETGPVDRILLDAPCSNSGVLNRNADARWQKKPEDLKRLAELQLSLLEKAYTLLKPGGVLVYSTCSIFPDENQEVVDKFLSRHKDVKISLPSQYAGKSHATPEACLQTLPFLHNVDGAFVARLEKK